MTLYEALIKYRTGSPKAPALRYFYKTISYAELCERVDDAAARLVSLGVKSGDAVTVRLPNIPECVYIMYAVSKLGAIFHAIHPLTKSPQIVKYMQGAGSRVLVLLQGDCVELSREKFDAKIVTVNPLASLGKAASFCYSLVHMPVKGSVLPFIDLFSVPPASIHIESAPSTATPAVYLNSGGTDGSPKLIMLSAQSINALALRAESIVGGALAGGYMLAALPTFHGFGLAMGIHAALINGAASVLQPRFNAQKTIKLIAQNKMHFIIGVPNLFRALLNDKRFKGDKLRNIRAAFVGGDTVATSLIKAFDSRVESAGGACRLYQGYGLTETVTVCAVNTAKENSIGSCGKPLNGIDIKIISDGAEVQTGERGEIAVSGDTVMIGYKDDAELTNNTVRDFNGKKYVFTGDIGYVDGDGNLYFTQRLKRIIKIAGISVFPSEIEEVVSSVAGVSECAAIDYEERGKTFIALFFAGESDESEIITALNAALTKYCQPSKIIKMQKLPRTAVMKVDVKELKKLL